MQRLYPERRPLRTIEKGMACLEGALNRLSNSTLNPFYHLGALTVLFLVVLVITGLYLTIFYRPGLDRAYETVADINAGWLGALMHNVHHYASMALIVTILLHALKMFLSDRFWGSRWLAWVSGWAMLVLIWTIGVLGYILIWDERSQWLLEYGIEILGGTFAYAFVTPGTSSQTFAFFVIVLFLHIFLALLILVGLVIHLVRLQRPRFRPPRWLVAEATLLLITLAIALPVRLLPKADMSRLVGTVPINWFYLGFLPLAQRLGSLSFWGGSVVLFGLALALPWLLRGRDTGPATVIEDLCLDCKRCARECPYGAIQMVPRHDESRYELVARVDPTLCTGCGICFGTCPTLGIGPSEIQTEALWAQFEAVLNQHVRDAGEAPVALFTCQRHTALGTLPAQRRPVEATDPLLRQHTLIGNLPNRPPELAGAWHDAQSHNEAPERSAENPGDQQYFNIEEATIVSDTADTFSTLILPLPCVGMINVKWIQQSLKQGASGVVIVGCPAEDCSFREGPHWLGRRLKRPRDSVRWIDASPGDREKVSAALSAVRHESLLARDGSEETTEGVPSRQTADERFFALPLFERLRVLGAGLLILAFTFGVALAAERPVSAESTSSGQIRLVLNHTGELKAASKTMLSPEELANLPEGVTPEQVLGGERFPVRIRLTIDGEPAFSRTYTAGGLRHEGVIYAIESLTLTPGSHRVRVEVIDDGSTWQPAFHGTVDVEAGRVKTLLFKSEQETFMLYEPDRR